MYMSAGTSRLNWRNRYYLQTIGTQSTVFSLKKYMQSICITNKTITRYKVFIKKAAVIIITAAHRSL